MTSQPADLSFDPTAAERTRTTVSRLSISRLSMDLPYELDIDAVPAARLLAILKRTNREMRREVPLWHMVLAEFLKGGEIRVADGDRRFHVYRGFYSELARRHDVDPKTIRYWLSQGLEWYERRLQVMLEHEAARAREAGR